MCYVICIKLYMCQCAMCVKLSIASTAISLSVKIENDTYAEKSIPGRNHKILSLPL